MITARNEFEAIPAFEHLAGCTLGSWTARETTAALIEVLHLTTSINTEKYWKELAELKDDDEYMLEIQEDVAEEINYHSPLPPYCVVTLQDNEWRVCPFPDDEVERVEELPEERTEDELLVVNDHGNATLYTWDPNKFEYTEEWSMV